MQRPFHYPIGKSLGSFLGVELADAPPNPQQVELGARRQEVLLPFHVLGGLGWVSPTLSRWAVDC